MNHRERYKAACAEALQGFELDYTRIRKDLYERSKQILKLTREGMLSKDIAKYLNITPKTVQKFWRRQNFPTLQNICPPLQEERPGWKGGVKVDKSGHMYKRTPGHPYGSKYGCYVAVHRLVMEQHLKRYLTKKEVVHHLDKDPSNNDIDNLQLFESNAEHLKQELKGQRPKWSASGKVKIQHHALQRPRDPITKRFL